MKTQDAIMQPEATCRKCGVPLDRDAREGICPTCLFTQLAAPLPESGAEEIPTVVDHASRLTDPQSPGTHRPPAIVLARFGDYELIRELGRGGMGVVYQARQVSLNRFVAVKMILTGPLASKEYVHRFKVEASVAAMLKHANIVAIHEVGVHQGQHYFSMDYVEGQSLTEVANGKPLPALRAARYLAAIAKAAHYAHEKGVLHRDLKPSNVLIDAHDQPQILDFGLAKRMDGSSELTLSGQVLGSPNYMPPEQAGGSRVKVSRASDVYAMGAILFHLLTGRPPFQSETVSETLHQVHSTDPVSPRLINPSVPRDLETICLKCLEKEPPKRYATAQELADELERYLSEEPILARPVSAPEKVWRWCRRKPALASAVGLATALLLIVSIGSSIAALHFKRTRQATALNLYAADIKGANTALEEHDLPGARRLLDQIAASPDQRDLRGWEWRYLMAQCRSDELATLRGHDSSVMEVAFSANDQMLASISGDGVVKLWDWRLGKEILSWQAHRVETKHPPSTKDHALLFLPGKSTLVTSGADGFVRFWNLGSTNPLAQFEQPKESLGSLACSPDGHLLACGSWWISLWDISNISKSQPERMARWAMPNSWVARMVFLPDGQSLVVGGRTTIRCWDISNPREPKERTQINGSRNFAFSPDGQSLFSESRDPECFMRFDLPSGKRTPLAQTRGASAWTLSVSPDGRSLVSSPFNGKIVFWDLAEEHSPVTLTGHETWISGFAFTSDGKILASASQDKTVRLWDAAAVWRGDSRGPATVQHGIIAHTVGFSPDSKYLASIHWEKESDEKTTSTNQSAVNQSTVKLWDVTTRAEVTTAPQPGPKRGGGHRIVFSPNGKLLAADDGGILRLYTVPALLPLNNWPGGGPAFSPDSSSIFYGSSNRIGRRHLQTGEQMQIGAPAEGVSFVALSPDGATVVTSGDGGTMTFWDVPGKRPPVTVEEHQRQAWGLAFSPDGQMFASASWDMTAVLWNVKERRKVAVLRGHDSPLWTVAFSPDGRTLATGGYDKTVRLWNLRTRRQVAVLRGHSVNVSTVAFSPDGQWLASGADAGVIRFWHAPTFEEIAAAQKAKEERK